MRTTTHLLLDIEGTTCPITFVSDVLFPYAKAELAQFLAAHHHETAVQVLISDAWQEWHRDQDPTSQNLLHSAPNEEEDTEQQAIIQYLQHLIEIDRKSTALKDLREKSGSKATKTGKFKQHCFPKPSHPSKAGAKLG